MTDKAGSGDTSSIHDRLQERKLDQLYDFHLSNCDRIFKVYIGLLCQKNYLFKPLIVVIVPILDRC